MSAAAPSRSTLASTQSPRITPPRSNRKCNARAGGQGHGTHTHNLPGTGESARAALCGRCATPVCVIGLMWVLAKRYHVSARTLSRLIIFYRRQSSAQFAQTPGLCSGGEQQPRLNKQTHKVQAVHADGWTRRRRRYNLVLLREIVFLSVLAPSLSAFAYSFGCLRRAALSCSLLSSSKQQMSANYTIAVWTSSIFPGAAPRLALHGAAGDVRQPRLQSERHASGRGLNYKGAAPGK